MNTDTGVIRRLAVGEKPDWDGDRYGGELVLFACPSLYGQPIYYTDGAIIPYVITLPLGAMRCPSCKDSGYVWKDEDANLQTQYK